MTGFKVGDRVRVVGNTKVKHHYNIGDELTVEKFYDTKRYGVRGSGDGAILQIICIDDLELIEECDTMAHNNGDLIKAQVSRDSYGAPVYNLFVKFGEFYYNLSSPKQMRGAKSLPRGSRHTVGTLSGAGDHMLAAIEGKDSEVSDKDVPFDSGGITLIWDDEGEAYTSITASEIEKRNEEAIERLKEFQKAFDASGFKMTSECLTTNKLSDVDFVKIKGT